MASGYTDEAENTFNQAGRAYNNAPEGGTEEALALLAKATASQALALHRIADHLRGN